MFAPPLHNSERLFHPLSTRPDMDPSTFVPDPTQPRTARQPSMAAKRVTPTGPGTMRTDTPTFVVLLIGTVLLVALLTFVPALLLGPIVQGLTNQLF